MSVGAGGLLSALGAAHLGPTVLLEVLAEDDVVGDDEPIDAGFVRRAGLLDQPTPAAGSRIFRGKIDGLDGECGGHGFE